MQNKSLRIGFISTRLSGTDGVSLEVEKLSIVLRRMGHEPYYCAGELGGYASKGTLIPRLHFNEPTILALSQRAFGTSGVQPSSGATLVDDILHTAEELRAPLRQFISSNRLDVLFIQNALAIPMNLPLGVSLAQIIEELAIPTLAHHHDFYWERSRYQSSTILDLLDTYFPPNLPTLRHLTINSIAQTRLKLRRGLESTLIPNVHDFAVPAPPIDDYNQDFRPALGLLPGQPFLLQPTRVIPRKGIELAIELVGRMPVTDPRLYITHAADDEGLGYWQWLQREAQAMGVQLELVDHLIAPARAHVGKRKIYSLWDAYPHADLVTYPSLYEGFGNALLELVYFKRLAVVNRYPVYNADIRPLGFDFIELDGYVPTGAVNQAYALMHDPASVQAMTDRNYEIAQEHFSFETLEKLLAKVLEGV